MKAVLEATPTTRTMATTVDVGDLQKFPVEMCNEIYKHLLVETSPIAITRYVQNRRNILKRMDGRRKTPAGNFYDPYQNKYVAARCMTISRLMLIPSRALAQAL